MLVMAFNLASAAFLVSSVIQGKVRMSSAIAFSRASTSWVICALASAPKVSSMYFCPEKVAELAIDRGDAAGGPRALLPGTGEVAAPEVEGLVLEGFRESRRAGTQQVVGEVGAPGIDRRVRQVDRDLFDVVGLADVEGLECRRSGGLEILVPGKVGRQLSQLPGGSSCDRSCSGRAGKRDPSRPWRGSSPTPAPCAPPAAEFSADSPASWNIFVMCARKRWRISTLFGSVLR